MRVKVQWVDGVNFVAESAAGHKVMIDGPAQLGGNNLGSRPMEMMLMGMGGCASTDVISMLKKSRQQVIDCVAELEATRAEAMPAVFTAIQLRFIVTGHKLKEAAVKRAVSLSVEKYCSAAIMMAAAGVSVSHSCRIVEMDQ